MNDLLTKDLVAYDPLSETTRRERKALLGLSIMAIALVKVPLVPEKIGALGIELTLSNQQNFLVIYSLVLFYFLSAFFIYALTDYLAWRRAKVISHHQYTQQWVAARQALGKEGEARLDEEMKKNGDLAYRGLASYHLAEGAARVRAIFEFGVPLVTACYAILVLLQYGR